MGRIWYAVRFVLGYATYVLMHLLFSLFWVPLAVLVIHGPLRRRLFASAFYLSLAFFIRHYWRWLGALRFAEISGVERARAAEPAVYVSNHRGRLDGIFILSLVRNTGVVMKASYIRHPFFSTFARWFDFVSVDAESVAQLAQMLEHCRQILAAGRNLLVFPEGTRAPSARMLPFRDTAFKLAQAAGVPVVPVVMHTDIPLLGKRLGGGIPLRPFVVTIRFLEPVRSLPDEKASDFAARVEREIARNLAQLDRGTVWEQLPGGRVAKTTGETVEGQTK